MTTSLDPSSSSISGVQQLLAPSSSLSSSLTSATTMTRMKGKTFSSMNSVGQKVLFPFYSLTTIIINKFMNNNNSNNLPRLRLNWTRLYSLPNEILPSLVCALLVAWVPTLLFQGSWWELSFLIMDG